MSSIDSLRTLLVEQLKDLYDAEKRLTKALPKMAKKATHQDLVAAIEAHLEETEDHATRVEQAFELLEETAKSKPCAGIRGIIEEGEEHASDDYEDDSLRDAAIIGAAQRAEHYEIAAYGTAAAHAKLLGLNDVVQILEGILQEEKAADEKLTTIAETVVNPHAASEDDEDESDDEEGDEEADAVGASAGGRAGSRSGSARGGRAASTTGRSAAASKGRRNR